MWISAKFQLWKTSTPYLSEGLPQRERLIKLNKIAIQQMSVLQEVENRKLLR
jgi:hypothetical protein